ncbi:MULTISPECIES: 3-hydroxyisobutyryl-CoA hydrolase [unclassified Corynebacterium]|uniref:3-hydroxyisobutyryl-CoA hydrolase n=1 Tax=unclassified Corynebacterium TaxID=2624378 RepID=UPI0029CA8AB5|nr:MULTISPECIES: 3-hydroxyisobutyryl-CoA hydrolase [unclassified Corynebacterium]WPF66814.1 3-hydroxyisobutyryl-CoA hydrolase [Corynebacterium sp. 22KM0430]WPF69302.1 3-hydroxyisobutyryl-CoA hydrolase [Corynebacterium sp. 21KM1197]
MTDTTPPVLTHVDQTTGIIQLNRPKALNSLNPEMVHAIAQALEQWRDNPEITQVLIESATPKGFCAGGDVRYARERILAGEERHIDEFFDEEYAMNKALAAYPKPYVALIDGVVMGGGLGVSAHGSHRVVTENAFASMPEMVIGYITDVGMSWVLQHLPGSGQALGAFLGITAWRLNPTEMLWTGLATHYVPSAELGQARQAILDHGVERALARWENHPEEENRLLDLLPAIEASFAHSSWGEVEAAAREYPELWSVVEESLREANPASVVAAAALFAANSAVGVNEGIDNEARLAFVLRREANFAEGVRAILVDKDHAATFAPSEFADVDEAAYARLLNPSA